MSIGNPNMATQLVPLPEVERLSTTVIRILAGNPGKVSPFLCSLFTTIETDHANVLVYITRFFSSFSIMIEHSLTDIFRHKHIPSWSRPSSPLNRHWGRSPPLGHVTPIGSQRRECRCPRSIIDTLASRSYKWRT